jgi:hypothetical protein
LGFSLNNVITAVKYQLDKHKADQLADVHTFLFGKQGRKVSRKKNIRAFSGFPNGLTEAEAEKKIMWLNKKVMNQLKNFALIFDIASSGMAKDALVTSLMDFAADPKVLSTENIKEVLAKKRTIAAGKKEREAEKRKRKVAKSAKAKAKPKSKGKGKKRATVDNSISPPKSARLFHATEVAGGIKVLQTVFSLQLTAPPKMSNSLNRERSGDKSGPGGWGLFWCTCTCVAGVRAC